MVSIMHCDDSVLDQEILREMLLDYAAESGKELNITQYLSGAELLSAYDGGVAASLCILDYVMPEMKGVEVAEALREKGFDGFIIFLSSTDEYVMESFEVKPFYCLMKPVNPEKLKHVLDSAIAELERKNEKTILLKTDDGERCFRICDILYISRFDRSAQYAVSGGNVYNTLKLRASFQDAVAGVCEEDGFVMIGTMVVNLDQIDFISKDEIIFKDGTVFSPPAVHLKTIRARLSEFWEMRSGRNLIKV